MHLGGGLGGSGSAGFGRKLRGLKVTADELPDYVERVVRALPGRAARTGERVRPVGRPGRRGGAAMSEDAATHARCRSTARSAATRTCARTRTRTAPGSAAACTRVFTRQAWSDWWCRRMTAALISPTPTYGRRRAWPSTARRWPGGRLASSRTRPPQTIIALGRATRSAAGSPSRRRWPTRVLIAPGRERRPGHRRGLPRHRLPLRRDPRHARRGRRRHTARSTS